MNANALNLAEEQHDRAIVSLFEVFPQLAADQNQQWTEILGRAQAFHYPANTTMVSSGTTCTGFILMLDGSVRVFQHAENGREVTLYRIGGGDICLMSLNSLIHNRPFRGNAISETDIAILAFSVEDFYLAMKVSDAFRNFILSNLVDTVCGMVHRFHETSFDSLDTRLAALLQQLFEKSGGKPLHLTHQNLAQELASSREVISRLLKKMEINEFIVLKRGEILLGRNKISLKDA